MSLPKAVVVGVGAEDGLGAALSRCYAAKERHVWSRAGRWKKSRRSLPRFGATAVAPQPV